MRRGEPCPNRRERATDVGVAESQVPQSARGGLEARRGGLLARSLLLAQVDLPLDVRAAEHLLGMKPVMHPATKTHVLDLVTAAERLAHDVIQLEEATRRAAPASRVDVGALPAVSLVDRASHAPADVATSRRALVRVRGPTVYVPLRRRPLIARRAGEVVRTRRSLVARHRGRAGGVARTRRGLVTHCGRGTNIPRPLRLAETLALALRDEKVERPVEDDGEIAARIPVAHQILSVRELVAELLRRGELDAIARALASRTPRPAEWPSTRAPAEQSERLGRQEPGASATRGGLTAREPRDLRQPSASRTHARLVERSARDGGSSAKRARGPRPSNPQPSSQGRPRGASCERSKSNQHRR